MLRHYSAKDFFRQMPNALLARYFHRQEVFADSDFSEMKDTEPEALFGAWLYLSGGTRNAMEAGFREVFEPSTEKGFHAIVDKAEWHLCGDTEARNAFVVSAIQFASSLNRTGR